METEKKEKLFLGERRVNLSEYILRNLKDGVPSTKYDLLSVCPLPPALIFWTIKEMEKRGQLIVNGMNIIKAFGAETGAHKTKQKRTIRGRRIMIDELYIPTRLRNK